MSLDTGPKQSCHSSQLLGAIYVTVSQLMVRRYFNKQKHTVLVGEARKQKLAQGDKRGSSPLQETEETEQVEGPGDTARQEPGLEKIYLAGL